MPELYQFSTPIDVWRYTDANAIVTANAVSWLPKVIARERWDRSIEETSIKVTCPDDMEPMPEFVLYNPSHPLTLTVLSLDGSKIELTGKVTNVQFVTENGQCELSVTGLATALAGDVPEDKFSPGCQHNVFDTLCGLVGADYDVPFPKAEAVFTNSGMTIQHLDLAGFDDGYFTDGVIRNGAEAVLIVSHIGDTIQVLTPFRRLTNVTMTARPGCDKLYGTCKDKFNNTRNRLGFDLVPDKNPVTEGF